MRFRALHFGLGNAPERAHEGDDLPRLPRAQRGPGHLGSWDAARDDIEERLVIRRVAQARAREHCPPPAVSAWPVAVSALRLEEPLPLREVFGCCGLRRRLAEGKARKQQQSEGKSHGTRV